MNDHKTFSNSNFEMTHLSDRRFEELIERIFQYRIDDDLKKHDNAMLMSGVGEQGRDVNLTLNGLCNGIIQCKHNTSANLNKPTFAKEIIKFALYSLINTQIIPDISKFTYYLACSKNFASTTVDLMSGFNDKITKEKDYNAWIESVLASYKQFKDLKLSEIKTPLKQVLQKITIVPINYSSINKWLNKYPNIQSEFFDLKKVVDSSAIEKGIEQIIRIIDPAIESQIPTFLGSYLKVAKSHLDSVKFIGHSVSYNKPRNIKVSKLYVEPDFSMKIANDKTREFKAHEILRRAKNFVILGAPGAGKSLFVKNTIIKIISKHKVGGFKKVLNYIPFRIELRKYSQKKKEDNFCIFEYLKMTLKTEYQIESINDELLSYMIKNHNCIFFFDGLDEIFDTLDKSNVRDDILNFTSLYPNIKCIITSREVGYQDNSFPSESFEEFTITSFNKVQIEKFVKKFYSTQIHNKITKEREINSCLKQLETVEPSLKSNPLILSLMSLLAINNVIIPDSKLEVYRSCTRTLVETRDVDEKELKIDLKIRNKRAIFGSLAYWQYQQMSITSTVNRTLAAKAITDYIKDNNICENHFEAAEAAEEFLNYAERRSIYFDDNFMHKTFLEFYTADYIFTNFHNNHEIEERDKIIKSTVSNSAWHIVLELLVLMIDEQLVNPKIIDNLIMEQYNNGSLTNYESCYFFLDILEKLNNISQLTKETIFYECLYFILNKLVSYYTQPQNNLTKKQSLFLLFQRLINKPLYLELMQNKIYELEKEIDNEKELINLYIFAHEVQNNSFIQNEQTQKFPDLDYTVINKLSHKDINLFYCNYHLNDSNQNLSQAIIDSVKHFGIESLKKHISFKFTPRQGWVTFLDFYISKFIRIKQFNLEKDLQTWLDNGLLLKDIKHGLTDGFSLIEAKGADEDIEFVLKYYKSSSSEDVKSLLATVLSKLKKNRLQVFLEKYDLDNTIFSYM